MALALLLYRYSWPATAKVQPGRTNGSPASRRLPREASPVSPTAATSPDWILADDSRATTHRQARPVRYQRASRRSRRGGRERGREHRIGRGSKSNRIAHVDLLLYSTVPRTVDRHWRHNWTHGTQARLRDRETGDGRGARERHTVRKHGSNETQEKRRGRRGGGARRSRRTGIFSWHHRYRS
jgi:hypothetical protein